VKFIKHISIWVTLFTGIISLVTYFTEAKSFDDLLRISKLSNSPNFGAVQGPQPRKIVEAFYETLSSGDGKRAEKLVVPEKRGRGAFAAENITHFYSSLATKLHVNNISSVSAESFQVTYQYNLTAVRKCTGLAVVFVAKRGADIFIERINAKDSCG
jgi:hypothetical protein